MVLKLLVFMVAVSALEGVFGLPDKQLVNGTQSKAIVGHGKTQRGRRLDKLPCLIFHGICQRLDDECDGRLEEGSIWCLHSRHFGCCIPQSETLGCSLNGKVYRDGAMEEEWCIILICLNGEWFAVDVNPSCGVTCIYGTTIMPFVDHPPLGNEYNITGDTGVYVLSQYGLSTNPQCGVDIYIVDGRIECIYIYCPGLTVLICCGIDDPYPWIWVNDVGPLPSWWPNPMFIGPNVIVIDDSSIYVICPEISVCVNWLDIDPWVFTVYVFSSPLFYGNLYGLSDVWVPTPPYPENWTMSNGGETDDLDAFITSWQLPTRRSRFKHPRKNPSSDHTGQVTVRPKIERSMSDIAKLCEKTNKVPCKSLSHEKCTKIIDYCMSRMSDVSKPGNGGLSDSSE